MSPIWNSNGWLADFIQIFPNKKKNKTFMQFFEMNQKQNSNMLNLKEPINL